MVEDISDASCSSVVLASLVVVDDAVVVVFAVLLIGWGFVMRSCDGF